MNTLLSTTDHQIRTALRRHLLQQHIDNHDTLILDELGVRHGTARIDIVVINGVMHGYEIKSDRDTLNRLPEKIRLSSEKDRRSKRNS